MADNARIVIAAAGPEDRDAVAGLMRAYAGELVDVHAYPYPVFDAGDDPLAPFAEPPGAYLIARKDEINLGGIGLRRLPDMPGALEIKRLYVTEVGRGQGLGRSLMEAAIAHGEAVGVKRFLLDTLANMTAAKVLYPRLGFVERPPYHDDLVPGMRFYERQSQGIT